MVEDYLYFVDGLLSDLICLVDDLAAVGVLHCEIGCEDWLGFPPYGAFVPVPGWIIC